MLEQARSEMIRWAGAIAAVAVATGCGGAESDPRVPDDDGASDDELSAPYNEGDDAALADDDGELGEAEDEEAPVTFVLENTHPDQDLVFSLDQGWQPVLFGYSGEPPNAEPIIMFSKFCTAACDAEPADRCPSCPQPTEIRDIKEAQKREVVEPGDVVEVEWDAEIFRYADTEATRDGEAVSCECYEKEPVPEDVYTIRSCGFRMTDEPNRPSIYQCVEAEMEVPAEEPIRIELEFPHPDDDSTQVGG